MNVKTNTFSKQEVEDYEKKRYKGLDQKIVHSREIRILTQLFDEIGNPVGLTLDLPCGYGRFTKFLIAKGCVPICGDYSLQMVKKAVLKINALKKKNGVVSDAKSPLPFRSNSFDLIFSMRFFHHVHHSNEREFILKEFSRISKKWILISFYQQNKLHEFQRIFRNIFKKKQAKIKMISSYELEKLAQKTGLKIIRKIPLIKGIHAQQIVLLKKQQ